MLGQPAGGERAPAELARAEKFLKGKLAAAAEHFNRDQKKGFQYLQARRKLRPQRRERHRGRGAFGGHAARLRMSLPGQPTLFAASSVSARLDRPGLAIGSYGSWPTLSQSLKLLPSSLEPSVVARFLRCCPGLAKGSIGEILGERDEFYERVRWAFMETFDFTGGRGQGRARRQTARTAHRSAAGHRAA